MRKQKGKSLSGFTLMELIIILAIIGVLAVALVPAFSGFRRDKKEDEANANAKIVFMAFQKYLNKCEYEQNPDLSTYTYAIGAGDTYVPTATPAWTVNQKINDTVSIDISNSLSNDIRKGKWVVKISSTDNSVVYASWTEEKNTMIFNGTNIGGEVYKLNTNDKQDAYYSSNGFALGTYPMG